MKTNSNRRKVRRSRTARKAQTAGKAQASGPFFRSYLGGIEAKGEALGDGTRAFFERRLGTGFGDVRLHRDDEASMAARDIGAKAFTWRNHVVLGRRHYEEGSEKGRRVLAHELTHVAQQRSSGVAVQMSPEEDGARPPAQAAAPEGVAPRSGMEDESLKQVGGPEAEAAAVEKEEAVMQPESLPDFTTTRPATMLTVLGKSVTVHGKTDAKFDEGVGTTKNLKGVPAKDCAGCGGSDCYTITGSLVITYGVSTSVTLPDMPSGLTQCQQDRVRAVIDGKIAPHEQEHVTAFATYNGTVTLPITYTGCKDGLAAHVQAMHDADAVARKAAAVAKSKALDPFNVPIDLDCEDKPEK